MWVDVRIFYSQSHSEYHPLWYNIHFFAIRKHFEAHQYDVVSIHLQYLYETETSISIRDRNWNIFCLVWWRALLNYILCFTLLSSGIHYIPEITKQKKQKQESVKHLSILFHILSIASFTLRLLTQSSNTTNTWLRVSFFRSSVPLNCFIWWLYAGGLQSFRSSNLRVSINDSVYKPIMPGQIFWSDLNRIRTIFQNRGKQREKNVTLTAYSIQMNYWVFMEIFFCVIVQKSRESEKKKELR